MRKLAIFVIALIALAAALLLPEFIRAESTDQMQPPLPKTMQEFNDQSEHYATWTPIGLCVESVGIVVPGEPDLRYEYWIYATWAKTFRQGDPRITDENITNISVQYEAQYGVMDFVPVKWVKRMWGSGNVSNVVVLVHSIDKTSYKINDYHKIVRGVAYYLDGNELKHLGDVTLPDPSTPITVFTDDAMHDQHYWGMCGRVRLPMVTYGYPYPPSGGGGPPVFVTSVPVK